MVKPQKHSLVLTGSHTMHIINSDIKNWKWLTMRVTHFNYLLASDECPAALLQEDGFRYTSKKWKRFATVVVLHEAMTPYVIPCLLINDVYLQQSLEEESHKVSCLDP
jgi:hypothetical protein